MRTFLDTYVVLFLADFRDTWAFLDARVKDAFDLKKTIQEVILIPEFVTVIGPSSFLFEQCPSQVSYFNYFEISCLVHSGISAINDIFQAQHLAEAVSAGLGNSFQGFVGKVFRR